VQLDKIKLSTISNTIKLAVIDIPDFASIQTSIIPCVTDIETGKNSTKGLFIVQLQGTALQEFSQNLATIKFQVEIFVSGKEVGRSSALSYSSVTVACARSLSYNVRNKKGQLKCLFELITQEELLCINSPQINVSFTHNFFCQKT